LYLFSEKLHLLPAVSPENQNQKYPRNPQGHNSRQKPVQQEE